MQLEVKKIMKYVVEKKNLLGLITGVVLVVSSGINSSVVLAGESTDLPVQDQMVTTIIDKSIISGEIRKDAHGNMAPDVNGMLSFDYTGDVYSIDTNETNGELEKIKEQIGTISGTASFPTDFAYLSAGMRAIMDLLMTGLSLEQAMQQVGIAGMPAIIPWTCNHCEMVVGDSTYASIVDVLDPETENPFYQAIQGKFDAMLAGTLSENMSDLRLDGRAFTGLTPPSFDPVNKTMSIRMAGCSAIVGVAGPNFGKMGTLCLNSTVTFDVSAVDPSSDPLSNQSGISAAGTSNCVTVLHSPTM
jgi:hypothetical protein